VDWVRERTIPENYVGEASANLLQIEGATWSVWRISTAVFSIFWAGAATFSYKQLFSCTHEALTVSRSVCLGIEHPCGTCDQILFPVGILLSEICGLVSMGRPLWRQDGSAICSVITHWSESLRTRNHTLLSNLRLPQPGGPRSRIYIPREQGGPDVKLDSPPPLHHRPYDFTDSCYTTITTVCMA
jgi:hypothetical protein